MYNVCGQILTLLWYFCAIFGATVKC